jgi:PKD repeat protein
MFFFCFITILSLSILLNLSKANATAPSLIVINEVEYNIIQSGEWFELYNNTDISITLSGWKIIDNQGIGDIIPDLIIEPHGFAVVAATSSGFTGFYDATGLNVVYLNDGKIGNGLANSGDILILKDSDNQEIDKISYGGNEDGLNPPIPNVAGSGHSLERCPVGQDTNSASDFIDQDSPTPGQGILPNEPPIAEAGSDQRITLGQTINFNSSFSFDPDGQIISYYWDFGDGEDSDEANPAYTYHEPGQFTVTLTVIDDSGTSVSDQVVIYVDWPFYSSNIILNELLPNPAGDENTDEYIELYNNGTFPIDLASWKVADKSGSYYIINNKDFPSTIIPAGGYFIIYRSISGMSLNNSGGEDIYLYSPDEQQKDFTSYTDSANEDYSYSRTDQGWQWSMTLTPGYANIITSDDSEDGSTKAKSTKAKSTKKASSKSSGSILGAEKAEAASDLPSSHHFSDKIEPNNQSSGPRWYLLLWLLLIAAFTSLVILRFLLWRKNRYGDVKQE